MIFLRLKQKNLTFICGVQGRIWSQEHCEIFSVGDWMDFKLYI